MPELVEGFNDLKKEYLKLLMPAIDELVLTKLKLNQAISKNYPGRQMDGIISTLTLNLESITREIVDIIEFFENEKSK